MPLQESVLGNTAPVCTGQLFVADGVVRISTIGLSLDGKTGVAKTIADLKTLWGASVIKSCDARSRQTGYPSTGGAQFNDILD
jgi:hypothetical protein